MNIRNNLLATVKKKYLQELLSYYNKKEAEQLITILIEYLFGITRNNLILQPDYRISESELIEINSCVKKLKKYMPVQYITGAVEFHDLILKIDANVLIPRPETEELVQIITKYEKNEGLLVLDVGTGSGCISISLSKLLTDAIVHATDISPAAISIAQKNAISNNQNIIFHTHNILQQQPICDANGNKLLFDIIVSNPPYVTQNDKSKMNANVIDYEPHNALFVPEGNPLIYYKAIVNLAKNQLVHGGRIYLEINENMGKQMLALLNNSSTNAVLIKDMSGKDRFIYAVSK